MSCFVCNGLYKTIKIFLSAQSISLKIGMLSTSRLFVGSLLLVFVESQVRV